MDLKEKIAVVLHQLGKNCTIPQLREHELLREYDGKHISTVLNRNAIERNRSERIFKKTSRKSPGKDKQKVYWKYSPDPIHALVQASNVRPTEGQNSNNEDKKEQEYEL